MFYFSLRLILISLVIYFLSLIVVKDLLTVILMIGLGSVIYGSLILLIAKEKITQVFGDIKYAFSK